MNQIENLVYLKIHLESEIKLLQNQSIKQIYEDERKNIFFIKYLESCKDLKTICEKKKELLRELDNHLYENCPHKWYKDVIDIDPERSQPIEYCEICTLSKN